MGIDLPEPVSRYSAGVFHWRGLRGQRPKIIRLIRELGEKVREDAHPCAGECFTGKHELFWPPTRFHLVDDGLDCLDGALNDRTQLVDAAGNGLATQAG